MKYIIELVADSKGVQAGVDALEQIGKVDKENAAQFKKTNEEVKKYTSSVDKLSKGLKDTSKGQQVLLVAVPSRKPLSSRNHSGRS